MARSVLNPAEVGAAALVLDLQRCPLFAGLSLEELHLVARACENRPLSMAESRKPLTGLDGRVAVVSEGLFEALFLPDLEPALQAERAAVLRELKPGDLWGEHALIQPPGSEHRRLGLRALGEGRLVLLSALRLRRYLDLWPSLRDALLGVALERNLAQGLALGEVRYRQERTDLVLDRIDSVAEVLLSGDAQRTTHQRKWLLTSLPDLGGRVQRTQELEQAYLPGTRTREDRVRCYLGEDKYFRTSRFGSGVSRREWERSIDAAEYKQSLSIRDGRAIRKRRYEFRADAPDVQLRLDRYHGEGDLEGLILVEAEFPTPAMAESFQLPEWLSGRSAREVTQDGAFANKTLARNGRPGSADH
jgi:CYTH domain-containing protein